MTTKTDAIHAWFDALNDGKHEAAVALFEPTSHRIKNAANPAIEGPDAADQLLQDFFARTTKRRFTLGTIAHGVGRSMATWTGTLTFAEGAVIGGMEVNAFTVTFSGIEVFTFNEANLFTNVEIIHETATVARAAAAHARAHTPAEMPDPREVALGYLCAETTADFPALAALFADNVAIRNAAAPLDDRPGSLERFATDFWNRTSDRTFTLIDAAVDDDRNVLAFAEARLTFKAGAAFGPLVAPAPFVLEVPVGLRFHIDAAGKIDELDVAHETTTALAKVRTMRDTT